MTDLIFEWDERKNRSNQKKHGVAFEEARTAFADENARVIPDTEHSETEERFVLLGLSTTCVCSWYATATGKAMTSYASFQPARLIGTNNGNIAGGYDEETP